jgi:hypothetical protein
MDLGPKLSIMKNEKWYWFVTSEGDVRAFANFSLSYNPDNLTPADDDGYPLVNGKEYKRRGHVSQNYLFSLPVGMTIERKKRSWLVAWAYPIGDREYCKLVRV